MSHRSLVMVKRTYLHIAVITLVSGAVWLILTIYQALTANNVVNVDQAIMTPINTKIDESVLEMIAKREDVSQLPFEPSAVVPEKISINEVAPLDTIPTTVEVATEAAVGQEQL